MAADSCILSKSSDGSVIVIDIPRSIEEAQVLPAPGQKLKIERRVISSEPPDTSWQIPEPKHALEKQPSSPAAAIAELMTLETVRAALNKARSSHDGPWYLPRVTQRDATGVESDVDGGHLRTPSTKVQPRKRKHKPSSHSRDISSQLPFIPEQSHYLLGTIEAQRAVFLETAPAFDLIVLDPPWPSRSVRRKKDSYSTVYGVNDARTLLSEIPVASRLSADGLVAIWITNKAAVHDILLSPGGTFSQWGLEPVAEWIWVKVTTSGEPVSDIDSQWRKPWERLLVARRKGSSPTMRLATGTRVVLGVPDLHSRKPNLRSLFEEVLPKNYRGLEVFARNLTAGWWSWGDEVLYFQQQQHWTPV